VSEDAPASAPNPRGEYSISSARGIAVDVISGSIDPKAPPRSRRRATTAPPVISVVSSTRRRLVIQVHDHTLELDRHEALTLAAILTTAFD